MSSDDEIEKIIQLVKNSRAQGIDIYSALPKTTITANVPEFLEAATIRYAKKHNLRGGKSEVIRDALMKHLGISFE